MEGPPQLENIDGNGMLVRMPAEGEESLTCLGEPKPGTRLVDGAEQPVSDYVSISVYGQTISLGDQVYLHPEEVGMPCEIGLITRLFEDADGERMVTTRWFWRSVHLEQPSDQPPYHLRELFLSHTSDDSPAAAIERCASPLLSAARSASLGAGRSRRPRPLRASPLHHPAPRRIRKVTVYHLREADRINKAVFEQPDTFFYKRTYEPQTGRFGLHAPHAGNCLTGADAAPAIATDEPDASRGAAADSTEPPAKRRALARARAEAPRGAGAGPRGTIAEAHRGTALLRRCAGASVPSRAGGQAALHPRAQRRTPRRSARCRSLPTRWSATARTSRNAWTRCARSSSS